MGTFAFLFEQLAVLHAEIPSQEHELRSGGNLVIIMLQ